MTDFSVMCLPMVLYANSDYVPFIVVLSDVQMPGKLSGIDLAVWLKTNRPKQPVALMTGYADELERARRTGVPIFAKPFDAQELAPLIP
ncbi:hypothetical protein PSAB6_450161 [Paraburkholderia sabiae]|nr:hypothetical protein PSAB6_450161 [Paraburkholderia sabiae]